MSNPAHKRIKDKNTKKQTRVRKKKEETIIVIKPTPEGEDPDFIIDRRPRKAEEFGVKPNKPRNVRFIISFSQRSLRKTKLLG